MNADPRLHVERVDDVVVTILTGELDLASRRFVEEALREALPVDAAALVIDLTGVSFLDSSAVEMLFALHHELIRSRRAMALVLAADALPRRSIEIYDPNRLLELYPTRYEAVSAVAGRAPAELS